MNGIHEVRGSIPLSSTRKQEGCEKEFATFFILFNFPECFIDPSIEGHLMLILSLFKVIFHKPSL
jgi:hypothetical protein